MPFAPYNNYTSAQLYQIVIFFLQTEQFLSRNGSGPRVNYGLEWFIDNNEDKSVKFTFGQSFGLIKETQIQ